MAFFHHRRNPALSFLCAAWGLSLACPALAAPESIVIFPPSNPGLADSPPGPATAAVIPVAATQLDSFRNYLVRAHRESGIPGLAVAIVQPGQILLLDAMGVRSTATEGGLKTGAAVTPQTRFALGPASQAFNSLLLARLANENVISLDVPAWRYWSEFRLADAPASKVVTLRQLLAMTAGLPEYADKLMRPPHDSPADLFAMVAQIPVLAQPGASFNYSEAGAATAGFLAAMVAQHRQHPDDQLPAAYQAAALSHLFTPLGMSDASFVPSASAPGGNDAAGHILDAKNVWQPTPAEPANPALTPALGLHASARDVAAWLQLELAGGVAPDGKRLLGELAVQERWEPQKSAEGQQYGMGWARQYYRGLELVARLGEADHQAALVGLIPRYRTGVVVLLNGGGKEARVLLQDILLNLADFMREAAAASPSSLPPPAPLPAP